LPRHYYAIKQPDNRPKLCHHLSFLTLNVILAAGAKPSGVSSVAWRNHWFCLPGADEEIRIGESRPSPFVQLQRSLKCKFDAWGLPRRRVLVPLPYRTGACATKIAATYRNGCLRNGQSRLTITGLALRDKHIWSNWCVEQFRAPRVIRGPFGFLALIRCGSRERNCDLLP
jgi:hypothetical protein